MDSGRMDLPRTWSKKLNAEESIEAALSLKTWAIVGLSNNSDRPAYGVALLLQQKGHRIIPVHPKAEMVHGEAGYAKLSEIRFPVDVVDLFVNSQLVGVVIDEAIALKAMNNTYFSFELKKEFEKVYVDLSRFIYDYEIPNNHFRFCS